MVGTNNPSQLTGTLLPLGHAIYVFMELKKHLAVGDMEFCSCRFWYLLSLLHNLTNHSYSHQTLGTEPRASVTELQ